MFLRFAVHLYGSPRVLRTVSIRNFAPALGNHQNMTTSVRDWFTENKTLGSNSVPVNSDWDDGVKRGWY